MHHAAAAAFDAGLFAKVFVTLLVIMDPVGTVPLFLALTSGRSRGGDVVGSRGRPCSSRPA